ncbi:MAG: hypothetical protein WC635_15420 [Bacteriovorax sp.]|jgi:hypothetical protein
MKIKFSLFKITSSALVILVLSSCVPTAGTSLRSRDSANLVGTTKVSVGEGKILSDNPIMLSGNSSLSDSFDLNRLASTAAITNGSFLRANSSCYGLTYCFEVRADKNSVSALQTSDGKWGFLADTPEFLQVNAFYHLNKMTNLYYEDLTKSFALAYPFFTFPPAAAPTPVYDTALPYGMMPSLNVFKGYDSILTFYADCNEADAAYFKPSDWSICLGYIADFPSAKWGHDSTAVYHETGHYFQKLQLNYRNYASVGEKVDLGSGYYDEAGSIGEGLSDYYSYLVNGRTHFAEWGAGRFSHASRPLTEDDAIHAPGISSDADQRLAYPQYVGYDPNIPTIPIIDIHATGMIISHYLVAQTEDLMSRCSMTKRAASDMILHLVGETLAELGDLTSKGTELNTTGNPKINLRTGKALEWVRKVNPINFRSFSQTFAKNLLINLSNPLLNRCNGSIYPQDQIESILDQYGLLLFRTYNQNRNLSIPGDATFANTAVSALNRKKSVLISKDLLILDPTINASSAFVIDDKTIIKNSLVNLMKEGLVTSISNQTPSDLGFNNNNSKVSPGEIVGLALNLYNNSNSTMAGVQVLANDWDHADATGKPCQFSTSMSNDQWPLTSEGGVPCTTIASTDADFAPICFIQSNETTATKWVSQTEFKTKMALDSSFCLDPSNTKDCFIRALKGADQANFSKLNPKSTWGKTHADPTSGKAPELNIGNIVLFEVSKHIPPGTIVDCRMRLRFTNCEDCYHDTGTRAGYDYLDNDYNGPRPYKIIHLQIPITD